MVQPSAVPTPRRAPTIRDVAREAGVSKSLVSLVLNGGAGVSEARKSRVLHAAQQLGYRPNLVAQSLSAGRRDFVAIFVANLLNPLFAEIVGAAKAELAEAGVRTMIVSAQVSDGTGPGALDRDNLAVLRDLRPSGLLTVGTIPDFGELAELVAAVPTVVASAIDATPEVAATVRSDDEAGIDLVVAHLAEQGVKRIAFVGGDGSSVSIARAAAFRAAVSRRNLAGDSWVEAADFTEQGACAAVSRMIDERRIPEAIIAMNDLTAVAVITELEEAGVSVPTGCRVAGYDNTTLAAIPRISLTSVDPDNRRIGREAAAALLAELSRAGEPEAPGSPVEPMAASGRACPPNMESGDRGAVCAGGIQTLIAPRLVVRDSSVLP